MAKIDYAEVLFDVVTDIIDKKLEMSNNSIEVNTNAETLLNVGNPFARLCGVQQLQLIESVSLNGDENLSSEIQAWNIVDKTSYDLLAISCKVQNVDTVPAQITGSYGIQIKIYTNTETYTDQLDSSEFLGNLLSFNSGAIQKKIFDISNKGNVQAITFAFYNNSNVNIVFTDVELTIGFNLDKLEEGAENLLLYTDINDKLIYSSMSGEIVGAQPLTMSLRWIYKDANGIYQAATVTNSSDLPQGASINWYRWNESNIITDEYAGDTKWEPLVTNGNMTYTYDNWRPEVDQERFKAVIVYYDLDTNAIITSNEITVVNNKMDNIKYFTDCRLKLSDGTDGNYNFYDYDNHINLDKKHQLYINRQAICEYETELSLDEIWAKLKSVTWKAPGNQIELNWDINNAIIGIDNGYSTKTYAIDEVPNTAEEKESVLLKLLSCIYYLPDIRKPDVLRRADKIICRVDFKDGTYCEFEKVISLSIGGTSGTGYTMISRLVDKQDNLLPCLIGCRIINEIDSQTHDYKTRPGLEDYNAYIKTFVYDDSGNDITDQIKDNISYSVEYNYTQSGEEALTLIDTSQKNVCQIIPHDREFKGALINITATLSYNGAPTYLSEKIAIPALWWDYERGLPVEYHIETLFDSLKGLVYSGPTQIIYNSSGTYPQYADVPIQITDPFDIKTTEPSLSRFLEGEQEFTLDNYLNSILDRRKNKEQFLIPSNIYLLKEKTSPPMIVSHWSREAYQYNSNNQTWELLDNLFNYQLYQPLIVNINRYWSSAINNWDGNLIIDKDNNRVMSAVGVFGEKEQDNSFTGVVIGEVANLETENNENLYSGVLGFNKGYQSFAFKNDGTAFIGGPSAGRIEFDGNEGFIESANYVPLLNDAGNPAAGIHINLRDGIIDIPNTLTVDSINKQIKLNGNIQISNNSTLYGIVYASILLPKPPNGTNINELDKSSSEKWHTVLDQAQDYYFSETFNGGALWSAPSLLAGKKQSSNLLKNSYKYLFASKNPEVVDGKIVSMVGKNTLFFGPAHDDAYSHYAYIDSASFNDSNLVENIQSMLTPVSLSDGSEKKRKFRLYCDYTIRHASPPEEDRVAGTDYSTHIGDNAVLRVLFGFRPKDANKNEYLLRAVQEGKVWHNNVPDANTSFSGRLIGEPAEIELPKDENGKEIEYTQGFLLVVCHEYYNCTIQFKKWGLEEVFIDNDQPDPQWQESMFDTKLPGNYNLFSNGKDEQIYNTSYINAHLNKQNYIQDYFPITPLIEGQQYTITMDITPNWNEGHNQVVVEEGSDKGKNNQILPYFRLMNVTGNLVASQIPFNKEVGRQIVSKTFRMEYSERIAYSAAKKDWVSINDYPDDYPEKKDNTKLKLAGGQNNDDNTYYFLGTIHRVQLEAGKVENTTLWLSSLSEGTLLNNRKYQYGNNNATSSLSDVYNEILQAGYTVSEEIHNIKQIDTFYNPLTQTNKTVESKLTFSGIVEDAVKSNQTTINGAFISTGTIAANQLYIADISDFTNIDGKTRATFNGWTINGTTMKGIGTGNSGVGIQIPQSNKEVVCFAAGIPETGYNDDNWSAAQFTVTQEGAVTAKNFTAVGKITSNSFTKWIASNSSDIGGRQGYHLSENGFQLISKNATSETSSTMRVCFDATNLDGLIQLGTHYFSFDDEDGFTAHNGLSNFSLNSFFKNCGLNEKGIYVQPNKYGDGTSVPTIKYPITFQIPEEDVTNTSKYLYGWDLDFVLNDNWTVKGDLVVQNKLQCSELQCSNIQTKLDWWQDTSGSQRTTIDLKGELVFNFSPDSETIIIAAGSSPADWPYIKNSISLGLKILWRNSDAEDNSWQTLYTLPIPYGQSSSSEGGEITPLTNI